MSKEFYFETLKEKYGDFPTDATNKKVIEQIASQLLIDARYYGSDLQLREKEDIINDLVKKNILEDKKKKFFTKKVKETACAMDFLMYSPYTDNTVEDDSIVILKPNHKKYKRYEE